MGTLCAIHLYGGDESSTHRVIKAIIAEIRRLESKYTRYRPDSITTQLNASAGHSSGIEVDHETAALLDYAEQAYRQSDGLFDITSGVLRRAWSFDRNELPDEGSLSELLSLVGWRSLDWQRPRLVIPRAGMELDFGGIVKEYAADVAASLCHQKGMHHGLIDLGGDIRVVGPHPDGSPWRVGIQDPWRKGVPVATVEMMRGGLATSGDYERCIEVDGRRYGHVLNPRTGWPVQGLVGVSVIASTCVVAGTVATIALLRGEKFGRDWLRGLGLPHLSIDRAGNSLGTF